MAEKRVIEYEAASELANDDWLLIDGATEGTRKARPSVVNAELANQVNQIGNVVSSLTGIAMGHEHSFAPTYDDTESYVVGDLVMYNSLLYKCTADTTGTWDSSKWQLVTVAEQLKESGKVDDIINKGESLVVNKIADLSGMQDDIDSKVADATVADTSIVDENHVLKMDSLLAKASLPTGAISTITDGSALPMPSLKIGIEAVQDLHGYDYPWPAGGGKNKLNSTVRASQTVNGITSEVKADNTIVASGESTQNGDINVSVTPFTLKAGTYTISINGTDTRTKAIYFWLYAGGYKGPYTIEATSHNTSFTTSEDYNVTSVMFRTGAGGEVNINARIQLESGSTATSYAPYSNICPISGFSAVNRYNLDNTDKSPFFKGLTNGAFDYIDLGTISWYKSGTSIFYGALSTHKVVEGNTPINAISSNGMIFLQMAGSGNVGYIVINDSNYESYTAAQFKTAMSGAYLIYELATPTTPTITDEQFNSLLTAFGVSGQIYTTTLKDSQGNPLTCYGGELSNENGVQTLNDAFGITKLGNYNWTYVDTDTDYPYFERSMSFVKGGSQCQCTIYKNDVVTKNTSVDCAIYITNSGLVRVRDLRFNDATAFKTAVADVDFKYEKATPQTIPQDNLAIATQDGTNSIWADSGDVIEGEYYRNVGATLTDLISRVEALENA